MDNKTKILIIEDDKDTSEAMRIALEAQDFRIVTAYDPQEGLQKAREDAPDLIILDVMFGRKERAIGFDYAMEMKKDKSLASVPILMVTAVNARYPNFDFSPRTDNEYLPVDEFIDKPAHPDDLIFKVKKLLKQKTSKWVNWPHQSSVD